MYRLTQFRRSLGDLLNKLPALDRSNCFRSLELSDWITKIFCFDCGRHGYLDTRAVAIEANIFRPAAEQRMDSAERSGCGIMPITLWPSLQMPEMLSREPLGLAVA